MARHWNGEGEDTERVHEREEEVCGERRNGAEDEVRAQSEDVTVDFGAGAEHGEDVKSEGK